MRLVRLPLRLLAALTLLVAGTAHANELKAVIELFTSQGCSSCPAADRLLGELVREEKLLPLSLPVDYWDYLGWRDTLALHAHTLRQKAYADIRGDRQVYTPQVVINGVAQTIGSDRSAIERTVMRAEVKSKLVVPLELKRAGSNMEVEIGAAPGYGIVWLLAVIKAVPVSITRGENRGKTITYHHVVRGWNRIGEWKGDVLRVSVPMARLTEKGADAAVALVQPGSVEEPGPIRGAAIVSLR